MPNKHWISFTYWWVKAFDNLSKYLESSLWGYSWCKSCNGRGIYPNSGMWGQPDGYHMCPDCNGHRWYHRSAYYASIHPGKCNCYLKRGLKKPNNSLLISSIYGNKIPHSVSCLDCKRKVTAKDSWLAILKWNGTYHYRKDVIKFLKENYYTPK